MNIPAYRQIKQSLPQNVKLIAVSKTKPASDIQLLYDAGQRAFGENKAQELQQKYELLPKDIEWHFIGHLQTNKIKYIAPYVALIHSIDSFDLLKEVNKFALKNNRIIPCLFQFHIATEESKFGFNWGECITMLQSEEFVNLKNIEIQGVMGMATFTEDQNLIRTEFSTLHHYFTELKKSFFANQPSFKEISMGMSDDYPIAIEEHSTMVRVGSAIFGARIYAQK
ncbi:MAG: YggS family pyridoxal phosphate-dependent enzyme [Bacteroidales bacterium]|nr:YggS family pyridoxal phosphate-dependent enzyme [Bacteroidales bacterium]